MSKAQKSKKKSKKKVTLGLSQKLLLVILPLLVAAFAVTAVILYSNVSDMLLENSTQAFQIETESKVISVENAILTTSGSKSLQNAVIQFGLIASKLEIVQNFVKDITIMDEGHLFMVDTTVGKITAHPSATYDNTDLASYSPGTFMGDIIAQINAGNTEMFTVSEGRQEYYVILSFLDETPYVLAAYINQAAMLTKLNNLLTLIIGVFTVVILLVVAVIFIFLQCSMRPMKKLTDTLTTITDGDFTAAVTVKGNDEIALMGRSLNNFVEIMRSIILDIHSVSDQLGNSSATTKKISDALNQAANSQADSMNDVRTTLNQLATGVQDLALHATTLSGVVDETNQKSSRAKENMQQTVTVASQGRADMEGVNKAMSSIVSAMEQLEAIVDKVGTSTEKINTMVGIISDISDQTNLLSLNAAIEAARAGDAGRGFAVVAEEIRKLAEVSASSASEISETINEVNSQVSYMVQQTEESVTHIKENSEKITVSCGIFERIYENVTETDNMISEIVTEIAHVDDVATNIAALSEEQSASTEEILASTENLTEASRQLSEDSHVVASSADDVSAAAVALSEHMKKFKI